MNKVHYITSNLIKIDNHIINLDHIEDIDLTSADKIVFNFAENSITRKVFTVTAPQTIKAIKVLFGIVD